MKQKKVLALFFTFALSFSILTGCGSSASTNTASTDNASTTSNENSDENSTSTNTDGDDTSTNTEVDDTDNTSSDNESAALQLLSDLTGSYQELWPVILDEQYQQTWLDDCAAIVGEDKAQAAYDKLTSMVTGKIYGEEAVNTYTDGNGVYDCDFTENVNTLEFDGDSSTIKGYNADGEELFSHTYHYVGMEDIRGLYEFESDDADSGEFTYFCIAPDTDATTYHIELRYGSDLDALGQYDKGNYAYWMASGISTNSDQETIDNCIQLFCTENLSQ